MTVPQDLRRAIRLTKDRSFTFVAAGALALGIGVNNTFFTIVNALCLSSPPRNAAGIVNLGTRDVAGGRGAAVSADFDDVRLSTRGDHFVVSGEAKFLIFVSYFDALDASEPELDADFAFLRTMAQVDGIRIFPNWWRCSGPTIVGHDCSTCTLFDADGGLNRDTALVRLRTVLQKAAQHGLVVDVSFARETVQGLDKTEYVNGLKLAAAELRDFGHILFDLQNEWNILGFTDSEWPAIIQGVRDVDPMRIIVASIEHSRSGGQVGAFVSSTDLDAAAYHEPRTHTWYDDTDDVVDAIRGGLGSLQRPIYLQEPQRWQADPHQQNHETALRNAKLRGAAAWLFHTQTGFDLARFNFTEQLSQDPVQRSTLLGLRRAEASVGWGPDAGGDGLRDSGGQFPRGPGAPLWGARREHSRPPRGHRR